MRRLLLSIGLFAVCALSVVASSAQAQQLTFGQWTSAGLPRYTPRPFLMPLDPEVQAIVRNGARVRQYVRSCSSLVNGQTYNHNSQLPVGNGAILECAVAPGTFAVLEQMYTARNGTRYCWKGSAVAYQTVSDPRLQVRAVPAASAQAWWWLQASSSYYWVVQPINLGDGYNWPLWLEVNYQTVDIAPARNNSCTGVLR